MGRRKKHLLTTQEAEAVIERRIEQFGLGALPRVRVTGLADGRWHVSWNRIEHTVPAMSDAEWRAWLERYVGPLDASDLQTTES